MVGWSRRNAESSERRRRWWATLTEEQRAAVLKRERELDAKLLRGLGIVVIFLALILLTGVAFR